MRCSQARGIPALRVYCDGGKHQRIIIASSRLAASYAGEQSSNDVRLIRRDYATRANHSHGRTVLRHRRDSGCSAIVPSELHGCLDRTSLRRGGSIHGQDSVVVPRWIVHQALLVLEDRTHHGVTEFMDGSSQPTGHQHTVPAETPHQTLFHQVLEYVDQPREQDQRRHDDNQ